MVRRIALLALACCAAGCMVLKRQDRVPLDGDAIGQVKPGQTTMSQVAALLGSPNEIIWSNGVVTPLELDGGTGVVNTFLAQGEDVFARAYHYRYMLHKMSGLILIVFNVVNYDTKYDDAYVFFDDKGTVTHVGASLDSDVASYYSF